MSTIRQCLEQGGLKKLRVPISRRQQYERLILLCPDVEIWMRDTLTAAETDNYFPGSPPPINQVVAMCRQFIIGAYFSPPLPHEMRPEGRGVWRLRTADVRLDGWFPMKNTFVIGAADLKCNCTHDRDAEMYEQVIALRTLTNLDGGNFEEGTLNELIQL